MNCPIPPNSPIITYLRHSPGDKQTIYAQQSAVKAYCEQNALIVLRTFTDEAKTGTNTVGRDEFLSMIDAVTTHQFATPPLAVVVYDLSRFGRNVAESQFYIGFLRHTHCDVVSITDDIPAGDMAPIFETLIHWEAQQTAKRIGQKAKEGLHWRAQQGYPPGGFPPVGYTRGAKIEIGHTKAGKPRYASKWVIDPAVEARMRQAWEMKLRGLNNGEIHRAVHLTPSARGLTDIFKRKTYCGVITCGNAEIEDALTAYVSRGDWERVQQMTLPNRGRVQRGDNPRHPSRMKQGGALLTGVLKCGYCGWSMVANGNGAKLFYRCDWRHRAGAHVCPQHSIVAYAVHDAVSEWIAGSVVNFETLVRLRSQIETDFAGDQSTLLRQQTQLKDDLETTKRKTARLVSAIEDGANVTEMTERLQQRRREQAEIEIKLSDIGKRLALGRVRIPDDVLRLLASKLGELTTEGGEDARALVRAVVQRAELFEDKIRIHYTPEAVMDSFLLMPHQSVTWSVPPREFVPEHTEKQLVYELGLARPGKGHHNRHGLLPGAV